MCRLTFFSKTAHPQSSQAPRAADGPVSRTVATPVSGAALHNRCMRSMTDRLFEPRFARAWLGLVNHDRTATRRSALRSGCGVHKPSMETRVKWHKSLAKSCHCVPLCATSRTPRTSIFLRRMSLEYLGIGLAYDWPGGSKSRVRIVGAGMPSSGLGKSVSVGDRRRGQFACRLPPAQSSGAGVPFQVCTSQGKGKAASGHGPEPRRGSCGDFRAVPSLPIREVISGPSLSGSPWLGRTELPTRNTFGLRLRGVLGKRKRPGISDFRS